MEETGEPGSNHSQVLNKTILKGSLYIVDKCTCTMYLYTPVVILQIGIYFAFKYHTVRDAVVNSYSDIFVNTTLSPYIGMSVYVMDGEFGRMVFN